MVVQSEGGILSLSRNVLENIVLNVFSITEDLVCDFSNVLCSVYTTLKSSYNFCLRLRRNKIVLNIESLLFRAIYK